MGLNSQEEVDTPYIHADEYRTDTDEIVSIL
jgi:hypothetical protein